LGKYVIPEGKKTRTIAIIIIVIAVIVLSLFFTCNTVSKKQPDSTKNGTSTSERGTVGSSNQSGSATIQSDGTNSVFADEYAQQEQSISTAEQSALQQGQSASASGQAASQQGQSISATGQPALKQQGQSASASEQAVLQQGQATTAEQRLSQTKFILALEQAALQQGLSVAELLVLYLQQGLSTAGIAQLGIGENTGSATGQTQQNEISQIEFQDARRAVPAQSVPPPVQRIISANMVLINSGSFEMETIIDEQDTGENVELRQVTITSFYIAKYEVTQREYENVMRKNPSYFKGPNLPVENVNWFDAIEYCNALSKREGLTLAYTITGLGSSRVVTWNRNANGYRLPTEEEWVYACRANTTTPYNIGNSINRDMANYFSRGTVNVGNYPPNGWGLYDMHGNVYEWCWNSLENSNFYSEDEMRVIRGGSWLNTSKRLRSSFRDFYSPYKGTMTIGFRVVQNY
jgi:formylglycine-generating enzyme required for sulfatase activity